VKPKKLTEAEEVEAQSRLRAKLIALAFEFRTAMSKVKDTADGAANAFRGLEQLRKDHPDWFGAEAYPFPDPVRMPPR
jgi:hypothetical protein